MSDLWLVNDQWEKHDSWNRCVRTGLVLWGLAQCIHEIQRERGLSSGYLSSRGRQFSDELAFQVTRSDQALEQLLVQLERDSPSHWHPAAALALATAVQGYSQVQRLRVPVTLVEVDATVATEALTQAVGRLLTASEHVSEQAWPPEVSARLRAVHTLLKIKETLGRERALGARVFARGGLMADELSGLYQLAAQRAEAVERLVTEAPAAVRDRWLKWEQSPAVQERERFRALMVGTELANHAGAGAVISWYEKSTAVIEDLHSQTGVAVAEARQYAVERQTAERQAWSALLSQWGAAGQRVAKLWDKALSLRTEEPFEEGPRDTPLRREVRRRQQEHRAWFLGTKGEEEAP